ncbi:hypothetical protein HYH03_011774 [Edaphochlamys debaryana]|uniref:Uncharacterized protein n=1 Tax=Edaphochlamys debaryana TaxID=47281 RepID=A0A835XR80_9CHLO|nr:hypothetical protein HYH03_011774 [Edaphochlamys debaryana]|eukprot:KAG2489662.1 hypothetical protein HYH03_011774 [Edaphochlamys debaryana]
MGVAPRWPRGPGHAAVPFAGLGGMLLGNAIAWFPAAREWPVFKQTFILGKFLFRSAFGLQVLFSAVFVIHTVEAMVALRMCLKRKLSTADTLGWLGLTMLLGYPAIHELNTRLDEQKAA